MKDNKKRYAAAWLVIFITGYFIVGSLKSNWQNVQEVVFTFHPLLIASVLLFVAAVSVSGYLWGSILQRLSNHDVNSSEAIRVHIASWLLKYIPGQAGSFVGKLTWGSQQGYSKQLITLSFVYESVLLVLASLLTSLPILAVFYSNNFFNLDITYLLPVFVAPLLLAATYRPWFYALVNKAASLAKKTSLDRSYFLSTKELLAQLLKFSIPRIITGVAFLLVAVSIYDVATASYLVLIASYIFAGIVGLLFVFVPSGIGVRETVLAVLLSSTFTAEQSVVLAVLARFYATIADIMLAVIYAAATKRRKE